MQWANATSDALTVSVSKRNRPALAADRFHARLLERASERAVVVAPRRRDATLHIDFHQPSAALALTQGLVRAASRHRGKWLGRDLFELKQPGTPHSHPQGRPDESAIGRLWFTGENVRPPAEGWDATFSFDSDALSGRNVYLPIWWEDFDPWEPERRLPSERRGVDLSICDLLDEREPSQNRPGFACAFINNPTEMRTHAIRVLSRLGKVDVYGRLTGMRVASKMAVAQNYKFMLCLENDLYPGYVTEKVFDAWAAGCVPLWWGSPGATPLRREAVVNLADFDSMESWSTYVSHLAQSFAERSEIASLGILTQAPDPSAVISAVRKVLHSAGLT